MPKRTTINKKITGVIILIGTFTFVVILIASYFLLVSPLRDKAVNTAQATNASIIQQTDSLLAYIKDYGDSIASSEEFREAYIAYINEPNEQNYYLVGLSLNKMASQRSNIRGIVVQSEDGTQFNSISKIQEEDQNILNSDWYAKLCSIDFASGFTGIYRIQSYGGDSYTAAFCKNYYIYAKRLTFTIFFHASEIIYATQNGAKGNLDAYVWMDSAGTPFYSESSAGWEEELLRYTAEYPVKEDQYIDKYGGSHFINYSEISGWGLISFVSEASLIKSFLGYVVNIGLILVLFYALTIMLITPMLRKVLRPIKQLSRTMTEVSEGNLNVVSDIKTNDEIGDLSGIFNNMIADIKQYIGRILKKEKDEQRMKYSLLISQIDPHFIYNTMNSINYLARRGRTDDIVVVNTALMRILQDSLRTNDINIMDTIEHEIGTVDQYLTIMGIRYGTIEVDWDVDQTLNGTRIPKNIIQPLVENAIFHGLTDEKGHIHGGINISIYADGAGFIYIEVHDNGRGIDPEKLANDRLFDVSTRRGDRGKHIGLANVKQRLIYLYGTENCVQIKSKPDEGTTVTLCFKPESQ